MRPSKLSSRPMTSTPALYADFTTARITAFSPGASPPPVRTPIFFIFGMGGGYGGRRGVAWRVTRSIAVALACHALSRGHNNVVTADLRRQRRRKLIRGNLRQLRARRLVDGARLELATSALRTVAFDSHNAH